MTTVGEAERRALRATLDEGVRAFNEGDFERAWASLPEDVEFHLDPDVPEGILHGRAAMVRYFEGLRDVIPDWRCEACELLEAGEDALVLRFAMSGSGRATGIDVDVENFQVWEMRDGTLARIREFRSRDQAFKAAGLAAGDA